jgi:hypothetical protein
MATSGARNEATVREEIIAPILRSLGYMAGVNYFFRPANLIVAGQIQLRWSQSNLTRAQPRLPKGFSWL